MGTVIFGPALRFSGANHEHWRVSVLVVVNGAAASMGATLDGVPLQAPRCLLKRNDGHSILTFTCEVRRTTAERRHVVDVSGSVATFWAPGENQSPRMAYASCNGFSEITKEVKSAAKNERWASLLKRHHGKDYDAKKAPFHLLLMGGDQVYGDSIWADCEPAKSFSRLSHAKQKSVRFDNGFRDAVDDFYFRLYTERWAQDEPSKALASIPTVMMWDDHDIIDGWGSLPVKLSAMPVYKGIYAQAQRYFRIFQMHSAPDQQPGCALPNQPGHSFAVRINDVAVVALDLRSERTLEQVMSDTSWNAVDAWLTSNSARLRHLFVMSSIPVVHPDFGLLERLLGALPGVQELEDDLRDHWHSRPHREERLRLIHRLLSLSDSSGCKVTIVSGDVHVAAVGEVISRQSIVGRKEVIINQLTSSAIVHPPPPAVAQFFLERVGNNVEIVDSDWDITARLTTFPTTEARFLARRNWLALEPDPHAVGNRYWALWHAEGEKHPYTKAIHPMATLQGSAPDAEKGIQT